jgi:DUF4097 and DUF4098 domain-containing protein YvlB
LNLNGDFNVSTINGTIRMINIVGSGSAQSENGEVLVIFQQNPRSNSCFRTLNGNVNVTFTETLSADFILKTLNGVISSDFPVVQLPGKIKYFGNTNQPRKLRVGNGGPKIRIDTLNGVIFIKKSENKEKI